MSGDVAQWLEELGLGQYAKAFEEGAIDWEVLPSLDHEILKELGVGPPGHRLRILNAIQALGHEATTEVSPSPIEIEAGSATPLTGEAERRQLTVMFCDLVGSTALSRKLDPEDLREVNRAYQDACKEAIERYEGYVARYMGDGMLAYFGFPQAHEDDAERAIHAGLTVVESVSALRSPAAASASLAVRVGIATGPVVVGDLIGEGASRENAVVGETPNLAARLQGLAAQNTVVIGAGTHALAGPRFEYQHLGKQSLKGIGEPVDAWRVTAPVVTESRFEARRRAGLTPLVGREHEVGLLIERWNQAKEGDGQVVLLCGEAGIGKSRIAETLRERCAEDEPIRLRYQCSPFYGNTALYPVVEHLERAARIESRDSNAEKLDKLESLVAQASSEAGAVTPLFAPLLSIPTAGRYPPLELTPERQKEKTLEALVAQLEGLSRKRPVLFIFEDVHWADPTSLELLELTIERAQSLPVLVVLTYRPSFSPAWGEHTHVTSLTLNRFTRGLASAMVEGVTGGKRLPPEVLDQIVAKTDGVPLFVEELTKTVLESGLLIEESDAYVTAGPLREVAIPATLHDSLMARLDRLGAVKEVAQTASVIGREFDHDLLGAVSLLSFEKLRDALAQLVDAGLVFRHRRSEDGGYIFKHALVQDAAYGSLLKSNRQSLHEQIARALQERFPERVETEPELLAHHFTEAGMIEPAVEQWKRAGLRAMDASANVEAMSHLTKALEMFSRLDDAGERPEEELALQASLASVLFWAKGWTAPETGAAYFRARELCARLGDAELTFPVMYGLWNFYFTSGRHREALELAEELLELARQDDERTRLGAAHGALGQSLTTMGRLDTSQRHVERSIATHRPEQDDALWQVYGEVPPLMARDWSSWTLWLRGFPDQALARSHETVEIGQRGSDIPSLAVGMWFRTWVCHARGDLELTRCLAREMVNFGAERGVQPIRILGSVLKGRAMLDDGRPAEGAALMEAALSEWRAVEIGIYLPWALACVAEGRSACGHTEAGMRLLEEAFEAAERSQDAFWLPEMHRIRGRFLLILSGKEEHAARCFREAIDVAREQGARSLELRAATSLGHLHKEQGERATARDVLAPVHAWFTEGFDTADLREAKALLDRLT